MSFHNLGVQMREIYFRVGGGRSPWQSGYGCGSREVKIWLINIEKIWKSGGGKLRQH